MPFLLPRGVRTFRAMTAALDTLARQLKGTLAYDDTLRTVYATDASAYRELPLAVAIPQSVSDLQKLIAFAREHRTALIPRTAGTSLAGQVVGSGIVVDVSQHFTQILEINADEGWVRVQPGVVRDELNLALAPHGRYFGPETSTANRAMIGGMVGNNSCGANSVVYGSARDHLMEAKGLLSDGTEVVFGPVSPEIMEAKARGEGVASPLEAELYRQAWDMLHAPGAREEIEQEFPKANIPRRNTGYAIDMLLRQQPFTPEGPLFNFCSLLAGSEGTLAFLTELKLHVDPLPAPEVALLCLHCHTIDESLRATLVALEHAPTAVELMDHHILERTKQNLAQRENRFFVEGDPAAILVVELRDTTLERAMVRAEALMEALKQQGMGYHFPVVTGPDVNKVWNLRKAGLGLLSNIVGDAKPAPVIEDTAVDVADLPEYIAEFNALLHTYNMECVHYAHAGSGELHLRPVINLKTEEGQKAFRTVAEEIAGLVKKYRGSLSGEHGDGRLRAEFIPAMVGEANYQRLREVKYTWDPEGIFNPGKIVDAPPMDTSLRFQAGQPTPQPETVFNWESSAGVVRAAELCNGSGDCRKSELIGGTMCPSYQATRQEKDTTRARANVLREYLNAETKTNPFDHAEIKEVLDLCLSCKGCKKECPSNVDMAKLKAEFTYQYQQQHGVPLRSRMLAGVNRLNRMVSPVAGLYNAMVNSPLGAIGKRLAGFAPQRSLPKVHRLTVRKWYARHYQAPTEPQGEVVFFCDEFTNYLDAPIGITFIKLLLSLNYHVLLPQQVESGRAHISKGLLKEAQRFAEANVTTLGPLVNEQRPLVGLEPSALLTFRDEYPDLVSAALRGQAKQLASQTLLFEEFMVREAEAGRISADAFTDQPLTMAYHGHCYQKALSSPAIAKKALQIPKKYKISWIPSGCCGMAGSFGYEAEHYPLSMQVGELVLFPYVRNVSGEQAIVAPGHSCRHQIMDGTSAKPLHPVEVLFQALRT